MLVSTVYIGGLLNRDTQTIRQIYNKYINKTEDNFIHIQKFGPQAPQFKAL